ncbi:hypothetical protein ABZZ47_43150 [Streptomyces sp. NPDC006465]|uniref:hypothetical protein n=1 Tax=Streptomyces sp. NPDC006465 TaxID=3157174 RepID=UPI0033BE4341
MAALAPAAPVVLTPTDDPTSVEKAVADSITADFEPETFLRIVLHRPDGGARIWYAWTAGGHPLGDRIAHGGVAEGESPRLVDGFGAVVAAAAGRRGATVPVPSAEDNIEDKRSSGGGFGERVRGGP